MLQDAFWTTIYTEEELRLIMEHDQQDQEIQNSIDELLELATN